MTGIHVYKSFNITSNITKHQSVTDIRHGQLRRTMVPDYSELQMASPDGYSGLFRTTPDYFGWLRRPQGFSVPSPRTRLASGKLPSYKTSRLPCAGYVYIYVCRIRAGFPYIQWRALLPMLVCGLRSQARAQATQS